MLIVSPYMRENFESYGDLLNFQIVRGLLKKGKGSEVENLVGALTVYNENSHIYFAGLAIFE